VSASLSPTRASLATAVAAAAAAASSSPLPPPASSSSAPDLVLPDDQIEAILEAALMRPPGFEDGPAAGAVLARLMADLWARTPSPALAAALTSHMLAAPLASPDPAVRARAFDALVTWALHADGRPAARPFRAWCAGVLADALSSLADAREPDAGVWAAAAGALAHLCAGGGAWRAGLVAALAPPTPGGGGQATSVAPPPTRAVAALAVAATAAAWPPHVRLHLVRLLGACLYGLPGEEGRRAGGGRWGVGVGGAAPARSPGTTATTPLTSPPPSGLLRCLGGPGPLVWLLAGAGEASHPTLPLEARRSLAAALLDGLLGGGGGLVAASAARGLVAGGGPAAAVGADALAAWVRVAWAGCDADAVDRWEGGGGRGEEEGEGQPATPGGATPPPLHKGPTLPARVTVHATVSAGGAPLPPAPHPTPAARTLAAARVAAAALGARLPAAAAAAAATAAGGGPWDALAALVRAGAAAAADDGDLASSLAIALPATCSADTPPPTDRASLAAAALAEALVLAGATPSLLPPPEDAASTASHPLTPCLRALADESGGPGVPTILVSAARRALERALLLEPAATVTSPLDTALATLAAAAAWVAALPDGDAVPAYVSLTDALFAAVAPRLPPATHAAGAPTTRPPPDALDEAAAAAGGAVDAFLAGAAGTPVPILARLPVPLLVSLLDGLGGSASSSPASADAATALALLLLARCRCDGAALAACGGEAGLARRLGLGGDGPDSVRADPRIRAAAACFLTNRLAADPGRAGGLAAAVRASAEGAAAPASPAAGATPSAAPQLVAALATGLVALAEEQA